MRRGISLVGGSVERGEGVCCIVLYWMRDGGVGGEKWIGIML